MTAPTAPDLTTPFSPATSMDAVTLRVGDLEAMSEYYSQALALVPLEERSRGREVHRVLGRAGVTLLRLIAAPDLPVGSRTAAGLFHTAFLFPTQAGLAAAAAQTARLAASRYVGASDHLVSEAFYFTDPEGNGIELYWDRPREQWRYFDTGEVRMDTIGIDPNAYLRAHLGADAQAGRIALASPGRVGHVHLQVGDLAPAREFYTGALGFTTTLSALPGALFASAGGYHHHVAMNTWNSAGAGPRAASLGLAELAITVPHRDDLDLTAARLRERSIAFADTGSAIVTADPWGTEVRVGLPAANAAEVLDR